MMQNRTVESNLVPDLDSNERELTSVSPIRSHAAFLATLDALEAEFSEILSSPWVPTKE